MARKQPRFTYKKANKGDRPNKDGAARHALERAEERTGLRLTRSALGKIVRRIRNGDGKCLSRQPDGREIWMVMHGGEPVFPVFDRSNKVIVTVLPADHEIAARHYSVPESGPGTGTHLAGLEQAAAEIGLARHADSGSVRIVVGAHARHVPTGLEGEVLDADMERRTVTIRAGDTGTLEDRIPCFDGTAMKPG